MAGEKVQEDREKSGPVKKLGVFKTEEKQRQARNLRAQGNMLVMGTGSGTRHNRISIPALPSLKCKNFH